MGIGFILVWQDQCCSFWYPLLSCSFSALCPKKILLWLFFALIEENTHTHLCCCFDIYKFSSHFYTQFKGETTKIPKCQKSDTSNLNNKYRYQCQYCMGICNTRPVFIRYSIDTKVCSITVLQYLQTLKLRRLALCLPNLQSYKTRVPWSYVILPFQRHQSSHMHKHLLLYPPFKAAALQSVFEGTLITRLPGTIIQPQPARQKAWECHHRLMGNQLLDDFFWIEMHFDSPSILHQLGGKKMCIRAVSLLNLI